jgi:hypothetical protein
MNPVTNLEKLHATATRTQTHANGFLVSMTHTNATAAIACSDGIEEDEPLMMVEAHDSK